MLKQNKNTRTNILIVSFLFTYYVNNNVRYVNIHALYYVGIHVVMEYTMVKSNNI